MNEKPENFDLEFDTETFEPPSPPGAADDSGVRLKDFVAYMQSLKCVFLPSGDFWPAERVDARLPWMPLLNAKGQPVINKETGLPRMIAPSVWLAKNAPVEQMTWAPGLPQLVPDKLVSDGGWVERQGVTVLNLYRPPHPAQGDSAKAGPWTDHVKKIYPDEADHTIKWFAHRVQRPQEKINHGLVLGGVPGIGKDTILEPVKRAVGHWNFKEVSPKQILGRFNGYLKSVVLRISEAKDMGEYDRFAFYDHMKTLLAAPPDVLRVDEKNLREHDVFNVTAPIMTTNHRTDGIYLPADDRRNFVAWSETRQEDFSAEYWNKFWRWYEDGGFGHVAAYLQTLDISEFNPKAPPRKTEAFWAIVNANRPAEDAEISDALDQLGHHAGQGKRREAVTIDMIIINATDGLAEWLRDRKNRRATPHRLERCGYVPVRNPDAADGLFVINSRRQAIYGRDDLSISDRLQAAGQLQREMAVRR
jgi:hypothetical protein